MRALRAHRPRARLLRERDASRSSIATSALRYADADGARRHRQPAVREFRGDAAVAAAGAGRQRRAQPAARAARRPPVRAGQPLHADAWRAPGAGRWPGPATRAPTHWSGSGRAGRCSSTWPARSRRSADALGLEATFAPVERAVSDVDASATTIEVRAARRRGGAARSIGVIGTARAGAGGRAGLPAREPVFVAEIDLDAVARAGPISAIGSGDAAAAFPVERARPVDRRAARLAGRRHSWHDSRGGAADARARVRSSIATREVACPTGIAACRCGSRSARPIAR